MRDKYSSLDCETLRTMVRGKDRRICELEQRLAVVWGLPDKWLNSAGADHADTHILSDNGFMTIIECADELRAALRGSDE